MLIMLSYTYQFKLRAEAVIFSFFMKGVIMSTTLIGFTEINRLFENSNEQSHEISATIFSISNGRILFDTRSFNVVNVWKYPCSDSEDIVMAKTTDGNFLILQDYSLNKNLNCFGKPYSKMILPSIRFGIINHIPEIGKKLSYYSISGYDLESHNTFIISNFLDNVLHLTFFETGMVKIIGEQTIIYGFVYP